MRLFGSKKISFHYVFKLCEAREKAQSKSNESVNLVQPRDKFGIAKYAMNAPILMAKKKGFFFDSVGGLESKSGIALGALKELDICGNGDLIILGTERRISNILARLCRLAFYTTIYLPVIRRLNSMPNVSDSQKSLVIGSLAFNRFFDRNPDVLPFICSDTSINFLPIAKAAGEKQGIFWWQDDFHHREVPEFNIAVAAILSDGVANEILLKNPGAKIFQRPVAIRKIMLSVVFKRIGVAVNATFCGNQKNLLRLKEIKTKLGVASLLLRLHPTSLRLFQYPDWIQLSDPLETPEDFARHCDLVFVGNSAIQLKILAAGTPVFHMSDLDEDGYDLYEYVDGRIVFGSEILSSTALACLRVFYKDEAAHCRLTECLK